MNREVIEKLAYYLQFLLVLTSTLSLACPTDCTCKWKGGKQSVECVNRGLRTFPGPIDPGTQVLDLQGNSFETLPPDHFMRLGLINLQKIYLSKCRLSHISPRTFRGLSNLVDLDLSYNVMREVPTGVFPDCQGLMRLILSGNTIPHLARNAFISLESLTTLEISFAGIELIEKGAFDGLVSLEWLRLNGNKLKRISGLGSLPLGLKGIWLEENQWDCDCNLLELRLWLVERNVANSIEPRCASPMRLQNATLKDLPVDNFACLPTLSPTSMYQKIGEGKNVSLLCKVVSVPESSLEWWFNGQPVLNSSLNMLVETSTTSLTSSSSSPLYSNYNNYNNYPSNSNSNSNPNINNNNYYNSQGYSSSSNSHSFNSYSGGGSPLGSGVERKSELLILNATVEENGTFLCLARNPAGVATANFTLKVLLRSESDPLSENPVTSLIGGAYPNALVIVVSTVSVIALVILLFGVTLVICKCSRRWACCGCCRNPGHHHHHPGCPYVANGGRGPCTCPCNARCRSKHHQGHGHGHGHGGGHGGGGKEGMDKDKDSASSLTMGCAGKLNRHLSEASTLTTATKSNGSVFLLSTSSELGIGDSNPDLIEGVKRVEGDGHETCFNNSHSHSHAHHGHHGHGHHGHGHHGNPGSNSTNSLYGGPNEPSAINPMSGSGLEPFPHDYGLPKSLNVSTLVRRASPATYSNDNSSQQQQQQQQVQAQQMTMPMSMSMSMSLPPNYDLAKYPKEYINPEHPGSQHQHQLYSGASHQQLQLSNVIYSHGPPPPGVGVGPEYYPAYMVTPDGNYVYNAGPEDFYVTSNHPHHGQYGMNINGVGVVPLQMSQMLMPMSQNMGPLSMGGVMGHQSGANCTCAPILEQSEEEKAAMEADDAQSMISSAGTAGTDSTLPLSNPTNPPLTTDPAGLAPAADTDSSSSLVAVNGSSSISSSVSVEVSTLKRRGVESTPTTTTTTSTSTSNGNTGMVARLQHQLKTQINESPDEGYEDESQEGTEI